MNEWNIPPLLQAVATIVLAAPPFLTHRELSKIQEENPKILNDAGIEYIDWWLKCITGVYRLAFLSHGDQLPPYPRYLFRAFIITYATIIASAITIIIAELFIK